jgi:putative hemolysin
MDIRFIIILFLLGFAAFFSVSESALFSLRWWRLYYLHHKGGNSGRTISQLMNNPNKVLITILLGNTIMHVSASAITEGLFEKYLAHQGVWFAIVAMTATLVVVVEITPKLITIKRPEFYAILVAQPIRFLVFVTFPLRVALEKLTEFADVFLGLKRKTRHRFGKIEFKNLVVESERVGILSKEEK